MQVSYQNLFPTAADDDEGKDLQVESYKAKQVLPKFQTILMCIAPC